jgi:UDP-GlcNAc:undecaprenyl-phosphate GlcNAc-1-phosphate transferase
MAVISFLVTIGISCLFSLLLTPLALVLARKIKLLDWPDNRRKLHKKPIPMTGGLAVLASVVLASAVSLAWFTTAEVCGSANLRFIVGVLVVATMVCLLGVIDDYRLLRGRHKLLGQLLAAGVAVSFGTHIEQVHLLGWVISLGMLSVPFSLFFLMGSMNALNLIDGIDGLLSCIGIIVSLTMAAMIALTGRQDLALVCCSLSGALLGFLCYNFPPASIFLGNSGSMLIGLLVGILAIESSLKGPATVTLVAPTALLVIPIFDTTAAIVRRKLTGRSIYSTDRDHLHHCLLRHGWTNRQVLLLIAGSCLITGTATLLSECLKNELLALLSMVSVVGTLVVGQLFGNVELALLWQHCRKFTCSLMKRPDSREIEVRFQGKLDWSLFWKLITGSSRRLNMQRICLNVNAPAMNEDYHISWSNGTDAGDDDGDWRVDVPLLCDGQVVGRLILVGAADDEPRWEKIQAVTQLLRRCEDLLSLLPDKSKRLAA